MPKLSVVLVEGGNLSRSQLDAALEAQALYGGSLDTCLLELGLCDQATLEEAIDRAIEGPNPIDPRSMAPMADALKLLSKIDAARWHVVPYRVNGGLLDLVCHFPPNLKMLDEVAFKTGLRVRPSVTSELRVALLVEQYYGVPRPARFHDLARTAGMVGLRPVATGGDGLGKPSVALSDLPDDAPAAAFAAALAPVSAPKPATPVPAQSPRERPGSPPPPSKSTPAPAPPRSRVPTFPDGEYTPAHFDAALAQFGDDPGASSGVRQLNSMLRKLEDRDSIPEAAFQFLAPYCQRVALFTVQHGLVMGWQAIGRGLDPVRLRTMAFPLSHPSIFQEAAESDVFVGRVPLSKVNDELARRMGEPRMQYFVVAPIRLREKVVTFLLGDCKGESALERAFSPVVDTADKVARTLVRLILARKQAG